MKHEFKPFDLLIIDECESFFEDLFSGLCKGGNFKHGVEVFSLLMKTSTKIVFMDGFMKNSSLSVAASYASSTEDIRLVIATYKIDRGTLWELPPPLLYTKTSCDSHNTCTTVEGLVNLIAEKEGTEEVVELREKLYKGSLF